MQAVSFLQKPDRYRFFLPYFSLLLPFRSILFDVFFLLPFDIFLIYSLFSLLFVWSFFRIRTAPYIPFSFFPFISR